MEALLDHEITLKVIGKWLHTDSSKVANSCVGMGYGYYNQLVSKCLVIFSDEPRIIHKSDNPQNFKCSLDSQDADVWIEFTLNNKVLGYCGQFTSPVEHKRGLSINYDSSMEACILIIDKLTKENEGNYSCSVLVPYPDGNGFLKINSTSVTLHAPTAPTAPTSHTITIVIIVVVVFVVIVGFIIVLCMCVICRNKLPCSCCCQQSGQGYNSIKESGQGNLETNHEKLSIGQQSGQGYTSTNQQSHQENLPTNHENLSTNHENLSISQQSGHGSIMNDQGDHSNQSSNRGANRGSNRGSNRGANRGSNQGANGGSNQGANRGSNQGANRGSNQGANRGSNNAI